MTGPGFRLAEYLNEVWDKRVGATNQELAQKWNYRSPGIISMWRTGKSRIPIERITDLAQLLGVDMAFLLPLWIDQYVPAREGGNVSKEVERTFKRLATTNEFAVLRNMRAAAKQNGLSDPVYTARQVQAFEQIANDDAFANFVLEEAKKRNLIAEIAPPDDED